MSDGFNFQPRAKEPESALIPGMAAVPSVVEQAARFIAMPNGIPDTSMSGPVMLQTPPRWSHDFDPETGDSRARLPAVIPIIDYPPATPTPPEGSSDQTVATTEFVDRACAAAVRRAVAEARQGVTDGFPALPGEIGEHLFITVPQPGIELTTATIQVITSIELPPGDWDVSAMAGFSFTGTLNAVSTEFVASLSTLPTGFPGWPNAGGTAAIAVVPGGLGNVNLPVFQRVLNAAPQTVFLMLYSAFTGALRVYGYGYMSARRRR